MPGPWSVRAAFAAASLAAAGCATTPSSDEELSRLRRELRQVTSELAQTKQEVQRIDGQLQLLASAARASDRTAERATVDPLRAEPRPAGLPSLPVVRLDAAKKPKNSGKRGDGDGGSTDDGEPPILIKLGPDSGGGPEKLSVDRAVLEKPDPVLSAKKAEKKDMNSDYAHALETLRDKKQAEEAIQLFASFLERYPKSALADNARYWMASARLDAGQSEQGILELTKLVAERPASGKAADALLRIGETWQKLGKKSEANDVFARLIRDYPTSEAAKSAERLRDGAASGGR
ncbi:MAG: tol-pal system protein YbgF [Myxococcota bacterium]